MFVIFGIFISVMVIGGFVWVVFVLFFENIFNFFGIFYIWSKNVEWFCDFLILCMIV